MKKIVITLTFFCCNLLAFSQSSICFEIDSSQYMDGSDESYKIYSISISNNSDNTNILWISDSTSVNMSSVDRTVNYFFATRGDFSLSNIMTELCDTIPIIVGSTFYKRIRPNDIFTVILVDQKKSGLRAQQFVNERIIVVKETDIPPFIDINHLEYRSKQIILNF